MDDYAEQMKILSEVAETIHQDTKNITFDHGAVDILDKGARCPNQEEVKQWIIGELRTIHFFNNGEYMPKSTYYTLKGMTRRGNLENVINYLRKADRTIPERLERFRNSRSIIPVTIMYKPDTPVRYARIKVSTGKKTED